MDGQNQVDTGIRYAGPQQVYTLAFSTLHALERAGLRDVIEEVKRRVLDREQEVVCDVVDDDMNGQQISYKPMIELLLYEIKHIARAPHVNDEDRRVRIEWAMTLAGV
jgi:hypothetical protein